MKKIILFLVLSLALSTTLLASSFIYDVRAFYWNISYADDALYIYSDSVLIKSDYVGNLKWIREILIRKIVANSTEIYGYHGNSVFKLDTSGNTLWVRDFSQPVNPASQDSNNISDILFDGINIFLHSIQAPVTTIGNVYTSVITLDSAGNTLNVITKYIQSTHGCNIQPGVASLTRGAWVGINNVAGNTNYCSLTKIDSLGNIDTTALQPGVPGNLYVTIQNTISLPDSAYLLIGNSNDATFGGFSCTKFDKTGNTIWEYGFTDSAQCNFALPMVESVTCDSAGSIYLIGGFSESGCINGSSIQGIFFTKLDSAGNLLTRKCFESPTYQNIEFIGPSIWPGKNNLHYHNGNLFCLAKYIDSGNPGKPAILVFDSVFGSTCHTPDSTIQITRSTTLSFTDLPASSQPTLNYVAVNNTYPNILIQDINSSNLCDLLYVHNSSFNEIMLYPNPVSTVLKIESTQYIDNIELYNLLGKKVPAAVDCQPCRTFGQQGTLQTVDCRLLLPGIYILQASNRDKVWRGKFIKE